MLEERPWGTYQILFEDENCKVKFICVKSGGKLSYQSHSKRDELWKLTSGSGIVTINEERIPVYKGSTIFINSGTKHRIETESGITFIEIQTGTYFGEDDIIRYSDEYGRV